MERKIEETDIALGGRGKIARKSEIETEWDKDEEKE